MVAAWTGAIGKMEAFAIAKTAPDRWHRVRDVDEVMRDRHMHGRATFEWIDDEIGRNPRADDDIDEG